jgi:hypothetical protein
MARTTPAAVQAVLRKDYDTAGLPDLAPFIAAASAVVDDVAACADAQGTPLAAGRLDLIETWLAAHFSAQTDRPYASKGTEGASASFDNQTGMYLEGTTYGQRAVLLDPSGCLAALGATAAPGAAAPTATSFFWAGKRPSEQVPYWERD